MTLRKEDIEHLASLARISVKEEEKDPLASKIDAVLGYVGEIARVDTSNYTHAEAGVHHNVMRPDVADNQDETQRNAILANAPAREGDYIKVGKVLE